jgi:peptide/nickel transport system substrate-binding protein
VTPEPLEPPAFAERVFTNREFDSNIISYCNGTDPEIGVRRMYISSNIAPVPFSNSSAYRNPTIDNLFDTAQGTADATARAGVYRQIQEILAKDLPYLWIVETQATRVYTATCDGFTPSGHFAEGAYCRQ